jgi:hypothetical protein
MYRVSHDGSETAMRRDDRHLLVDLSQINTALPAFALHVMDDTATAAEHHALATRLITLGQIIDERAEKLAVVNTWPGEDSGGESVAARRALSALVDMADALGKAKCVDVPPTVTPAV